MQPIVLEPIEVRRSGLKMWLLSLAGIPLLVLGVDVLRSRRIIGFFQNLIWPNGNPELLEARDYIWAVVMIVIGLVIAGYGVAELINPRPVLSTTSEGIRLRIGHPAAAATTIPWGDLVDVGSEELDDEGEAIPVLWLRVAAPESLPPHPWAARWLDTNTIALLASDWEKPPAVVAVQITAVAREVARLPRPISP
ncbi:hypothetical protein BH18ACT5_BH18ACT5_05790 [soil metagenome]